MAFVGQDGVFVWQKVFKQLAQSGETHTGASPVAVAAFQALQDYMAGAKGNPQLQILPFSEANADAANGTSLLSGASHVFGFYVKKYSSGTDNTVKLFDDATDDTTTTDQRLSIVLEAASQEGFQIFPDGFAMPTGIVITQHTTVEGTSDGSDGGDGFVLIGV